MVDLKIIKEEPKNTNEIHINSLGSVDNATVDKIVLDDLLDYIPYDKRNLILLEVIKKLRYNGTLELSGLDIYALSNFNDDGEFSIEQLNKLIYNGKQSMTSLMFMDILFRQYNLIVEIKRIDRLFYYFKVRRPCPK